MLRYSRIADYAVRAGQQAYNFRVRFLGALLASLLAISCFAGEKETIVTRAEQLFGAPLRSDQQLFAIDDTYVAWLFFDRFDHLFEIEVGNRYDFPSVFHGLQAPAVPRCLSQSEAESLLNRMSALKEIGSLRDRRKQPLKFRYGPEWIRSERYENAYVDKLVQMVETDSGRKEVISRFQVYFFQEMDASPYEVLQEPGELPEACLGYEWVYLAPSQPKMKAGRWAKFVGAGPNLDPRACNHNITRFDEDGFTIEEPATEQVELDQPFQVKSIRGRVHLEGYPIDHARVEIRNIKDAQIYTVITDDSGAFSFPTLGAGEYKFKVTKNGLCALYGRIVVSKQSKSDAPIGLEMRNGI
jgi:hypothetical protein